MRYLHPSQNGCSILTPFIKPQAREKPPYVTHLTVSCAAHHFPTSQSEYTIIIVNADKKEIQAARDNSSPPQEEPSWSYHYSFGTGATTVVNYLHSTVSLLTLSMCNRAGLVMGDMLWLTYLQGR